MTDLVYDYITTGVDMIINAVILSAVVVLLRSTTLLNSYSANQQATSDRVNYYKEYNIYDNTQNLSSADVISSISFYKTSLDVVITGFDFDNSGVIDSIVNDHNTGLYYKIVDGNKIGITYDELRDLIKSTDLFSAVLYEDGEMTQGYTGTPNLNSYDGGLVTGIKFTLQ